VRSPWLNPKSKDRWVFGDKPSAAYLLKFGWFKIVRHRLVRGRSSPDDPRLRDYWWARRKISFWSLSASDARLAERQDWCCPVCGMDLLNGEELQRHHKQPRCLGGSDASGNREIVHLTATSNGMPCSAGRGKPRPVMSNPDLDCEQVTCSSRMRGNLEVWF